MSARIIEISYNNLKPLFWLPIVDLLKDCFSNTTESAFKHRTPTLSDSAVLKKNLKQ